MASKWRRANLVAGLVVIAVLPLLGMACQVSLAAPTSTLPTIPTTTVPRTTTTEPTTTTTVPQTTTTVPRTTTTVPRTTTTVPRTTTTVPPSTTTTVPRTLGIALVIDGTLDMTVVAPGTEANPGDRIAYSFTVTNTGNVALTEVKVTAPKVTVVGGPLASLAPGASDSTTFTGTYTLTQADITAGQVDNTATASGAPPGATAVTDTGSKTVTIPQIPTTTVLPPTTIPPTTVLPSTTATTTSPPASGLSSTLIVLIVVIAVAAVAIGVVISRLTRVPASLWSRQKYRRVLLQQGRAAFCGICGKPAPGGVCSGCDRPMAECSCPKSKVLKEGERLCTTCGMFKIVGTNCAGCGKVEGECDCLKPLGKEASPDPLKGLNIEKSDCLPGPCAPKCSPHAWCGPL